MAGGGRRWWIRSCGGFEEGEGFRGEVCSVVKRLVWMFYCVLRSDNCCDMAGDGGVSRS